MRTCSVEGCEGNVLARGWCDKHYHRWYRNGDLELHRARRPFWDDVQRGGPDECWEWLGPKRQSGYGYRGSNLSSGYGTAFAHRIAYLLEVGPIPEGLEIDHLCRNRGCVNPAHLEAVTHLENMRRGRRVFGADNGNGRKTECPRGHPYDETNTYHRKGRRYCRACQRQYLKEWRMRQRAAAS